jgi:7-cyano-7-deazaguanine reductase
MIYKDRFIDPLEKKARKTAGPTFSAGDIDRALLRTLPYEYPHRKVNVELSTQEFTCVCPFSGLPDFARILIRYVPRKKLIELKSLKFYLFAFRNVKIYNEHAVNKILEDLTNALHPYEMEVVGEFTSRGGIENKVSASLKRRT